MSYTIAHFTDELRQARITHAIHNAHLDESLTEMATQLASDTTTHDTTVVTPAKGLIPGDPAYGCCHNYILLIVNKGKAGNLKSADMATAITSLIGGVIAGPPVNTAVPLVTGGDDPTNTLRVSTGAWTNSPTSYTYQWYASASNFGEPADQLVAGATSAIWVFGQYGHDFSARCEVTAINAQGQTMITSPTVDAYVN